MGVLGSAVPALDECGRVYVAGAGPRAECLRLNATASRLWREHVGTIVPERFAELPEPARKFFDRLIARGVLAWSAEGGA